MNGVIVRSESEIGDEKVESFCLTFQCAFINRDKLSKGEVLEILLNKMDYAIKHNEEYIEWID